MLAGQLLLDRMRQPHRRVVRVKPRETGRQRTRAVISLGRRSMYARCHLIHLFGASRVSTDVVVASVQMELQRQERVARERARR